MESHKKLLSILHIVYGGLHVLFFALANILVGAVLPFIISEIDQANDDVAMVVTTVISFLRVLFLILIFVISFPSIVGGIAVLYRKAWGMTLLMISGCLSLLSIPIGTALGIYTIWVFLEGQKENKSAE